jgi:hypothetical protein
LNGYRRLGPRLVADKVRRRVWSTTLAVVVAAPTADARRVEALIPVTFETVPPSSFDALARSAATARGEDFLSLRALEVMRAADGGEIVFARAPGGEVAASLFVQDRATRDRLDGSFSGIYPPIADDEALTEGVYSWPAYRRRRVVGALLGHTLGLLAERGTRRALAVIAASNVASLRAFANAGYAPTGTVRIGRYRFNRWSASFAEDPVRADAVWRRATSERTNPPSRA